MVYLIHFDTPLGNEKHRAQHYIGYADDLDERITAHQRNYGAAILRACNLKNIAWTVVRTWSGGRSLERKLKNQKHAARFCPLCQEVITCNQ